MISPFQQLLPPEIIQRIFSNIHPRYALTYTRLCRSVYHALNDPRFAEMNLANYVHEDHGLDMIWFRWPEVYQAAYAVMKLRNETRIEWTSRFRQVHAAGGNVGGGGVLPRSVGYLTQLVTLDLRGVGLYGGIPREIGCLVQLVELNLSGNWMSGRIPSEIGCLGRLKMLDLSLNRLTGPVPDEIGFCRECISCS
ncbi:L domain-like protein [Rhizoclosmatium globosum]|uniref:L domain-like protein n=1 Tax=Rhizoclosmatium globosum TaxID=329046 RepID=A0A1Y2C470_9FUNG|nr:L domain-like protein [Rhizoclosmatium globosum]|eukprot:ORY41746.1 L domain-like protein [Rhizoclosmatium globosum]